MKIKIIIADDHKILRDGVRSLIEKEIDMQVVGEANDGREAVELVTQHKPDIVIMDISMPRLNGVEATEEIVKVSSNTKVIALSMYNDKRFVKKVLEAGAFGYLIKSCAGKDLIAAIHSVHQNVRYFSVDIMNQIIEDYALKKTMPKNINLPQLTLREKETLQLIAEGMTAKEIGHELGVSVKSVEVYKKNLMEKLNLHTTAELIKYAIREGLSSLD